jgi:AcrR family transcriptional regulator
MAARTGRPRLAPIEDPSVEPAEEILIAASRLFAQKGFASTTTREIATAAGIQQPSLYYWFPTKFDILNRLVESGIVDSAAFARRIRRVKASAIVRLYALLLFDTRLLVASPYDLSFLTRAPELNDERLTYRPHLAALNEAVEFLLKRAIADGDVEPIDPTLARTAMLALTGVTMEFRVERAAVEPTVATVVRYAIRGIVTDRVDLDQTAAAAQILSKP